MVCKSYVIDSLNWEILKHVSDIASRGDLLCVDNIVCVYNGRSFIALRSCDGHVEMDYNIGDKFPPVYWTRVEEIRVACINGVFLRSDPVSQKYTIDYTWIKYDNFEYISYDGPKEILELPYVKEVLDGEKPIIFTSTLGGKITKIIRNPNWAFNARDKLWDVRVINEDYVICDHMPCY
jgi:hypothetical protein